MLKYYPVPNAPGYKQNYQAPITTISNSDNLNSRLNQTLNKKDRLTGGIGYMGSNSTTPNIFNFIDTGAGRNINANIAWSHNFTPRIINSLRYTFSRSRSLATPFFATKRMWRRNSASPEPRRPRRTGDRPPSPSPTTPASATARHPSFATRPAPSATA